jgi:hypothetical protein
MSRGRTARFRCNQTFQLLGEKYATCLRGVWDTVPICVSKWRLLKYEYYLILALLLFPVGRSFCIIPSYLDECMVSLLLFPVGRSFCIIPSYLDECTVFLNGKDNSSQNIFMYTQIHTITIQTGLHEHNLRRPWEQSCWMLRVYFLDMINVNEQLWQWEC